MSMNNFLAGGLFATAIMMLYAFGIMASDVLGLLRWRCNLPAKKRTYKYWAWYPWIRWFVPLPILLWFSKKNFYSHVWYDDNNVRLELTRKPSMTEWEKENMRRAGYETTV